MLAQNLAQHTVTFGHVIRRGRVGPANRPARFVGQDRFGYAAVRLTGKRSQYLLRKHGVSPARGLFLRCFTEADDRRETVRQRLVDFQTNGRIVFAEVLQTLRMRQFDVMATGFDQHRCGDFARPTAGIFPVHVLPTKAHRRIGKGLCGRM